MPSNLTGTQIKETFLTAINGIISVTGSTPATDAQVLEVQKAVLEACYSINPSTVPPPKSTFKNA